MADAETQRLKNRIKKLEDGMKSLRKENGTLTKELGSLRDDVTKIFNVLTGIAVAMDDSPPEAAFIKSYAKNAKAESEFDQRTAYMVLDIYKRLRTVHGFTKSCLGDADRGRDPKLWTRVRAFRGNLSSVRRLRKVESRIDRTARVVAQLEDNKWYNVTLRSFLK